VGTSLCGFRRFRPDFEGLVFLRRATAPGNLFLRKDAQKRAQFLLVIRCFWTAGVGLPCAFSFPGVSPPLSVFRHDFCASCARSEKVAHRAVLRAVFPNHKKKTFAMVRVMDRVTPFFFFFPSGGELFLRGRCDLRRGLRGVVIAPWPV